MTRRVRSARRGAILPLLGICLIGLFAFVAVAVDLGMLCVSRTQAQNAADIGALTGARTLDNKRPDDTSYDSNRPAAITAAKAAVTGNVHLSGRFTEAANITKAVAGVYEYQPQKSPPQFEYKEVATPGAGKSWTAFKVELATEQPTYFMRVMGVTKMPTGATAVAVHRPRDIAFALDMTGSMKYASEFNYSSASMNPDDLVPQFGHYVSNQSSIRRTTPRTNGDGEAYSPNNYCITTEGGPPIIRNFWFDPANLANPAQLATPVSLVAPDPAKPDDLRPESNAFHRSNVTETDPGDPSTYTPPTYDFSNYNPDANSATEGATPAPDWYGQMIDSGGKVYSGDRWRRADGNIYKTETSWSATATRQAPTTAALLGYGSSPPTSGTHKGTSPAFATSWINFRDPVWEKHGYDLDIAKYRAYRNGSNNFPPNPSTYESSQGGVNNVLLPQADRFKGWSMGPGYWGKTFFIWPPDPRQDKDWRRKFFQNRNGAEFDINDADPGTSGSQWINEELFRTGSGQMLADQGSNYTVNYKAILAWLKTGPQVLPPNLRAGRVVYYTSIPDDVTGGSGDRALDQRFWKEYIDYVLGVRYTGSDKLYGSADNWTNGTRSISTTDPTTYKFSWESGSGVRPHMMYTDAPLRPRLHFWFGPLSMVDFIANGGPNWNPGTSYEAQCWQLKAAMNSVLEDIKNNHPNDHVGLAYFSAPHHAAPRVPIGQDFRMLKNALFYPKSLLADIKAGNTTKELRPYNSSFSGYADEEIPNAVGSTDPNTGLALAFNLLCPSANLPSDYGTIRGRRGASKVVILESDGVPNTYRTLTLNKRGYDTYYTLGGSSGNQGNGNSTAMTQAYNVAAQIVKPIASTNGSNVDSGLSLPNSPARVYCIAFGDLFDPVLAPSATFRETAKSFLGTVQQRAGGDPTLPDIQIITGKYQDRITTMRDCLERIFQTGVSVTLIE